MNCDETKWMIFFFFALLIDKNKKFEETYHIFTKYVTSINII